MTEPVDGKALVRAYLDDVFTRGNLANMDRYLAVGLLRQMDDMADVRPQRPADVAIDRRRGLIDQGGGSRTSISTSPRVASKL